MYAKARCNTCGKQFLLDFGCMPKDDAIQRHEVMKKQGIYCRAHREDSIRQWSADQSEKPKTG